MYCESAIELRKILEQYIAISVEGIENCKRKYVCVGYAKVVHAFVSRLIFFFFRHHSVL